MDIISDILNIKQSLFSMTSSNLANQLASTIIVPIIVPLWDNCSLVGSSCQYLLSCTVLENWKWQLDGFAELFNKPLPLV